jgi:two-component system sensor kinase FixL
VSFLRSEFEDLLELSAGPADYGVWEWDPASDRIALSRRAADWFGLKRPPSTLAQLMSECRFERPREVILALQRVANGRRTADLYARMQSPGPATVVRLRAAAVSAGRSKRRRVVGIVAGPTDEGRDARDVKASERARKEAEKREAQLNSILDTVPDGMIVYDENGNIISFGAAAGRMFGYRACEVRGKNVSLLMPELADDEYMSRDVESRELHGVGVGRRITGVKKDGGRFHLELTVGGVAAGESRLFTGFAHDLTESDRADARLAELQADLLHVSRLNAMGQLSATLAHELNQPLTATLNYAEAACQLLDSTTHVPPKALDFVHKVSIQAERAGQIIRRLRSFVERREVGRSKEQLNLIVEEASDFAATGIKIEGMELIFDLADDLPPIEMDRTQVQQVVVNLVRNAIEALRQAKRRTIVIWTRAAEEGFQECGVADTGPGIAPELADQLFKPFVSTKPDGMGIGLSVSRSIVEAHGGKIHAEPNPGGGAIFRFSLPGPH